MRGVPLHLRLIDGADARDVKALIHQVFGNIYQILGISRIAIIGDIGAIICRGISLAI